MQHTGIKQVDEWILHQPDALTSQGKADNGWDDELLISVPNDDYATQCIFCFNTPKVPVLTPCDHLSCDHCFEKYFIMRFKLILIHSPINS